MDELSVGLVGCGRLAEVGYLPAFTAVRGARLVAVADPDAARRERLTTLAAQQGSRVTAHRSAAELIDASGVDAVILATPVDAHLPDAQLAAAAGLPTLVEKPPARETDGAARLAALDPPPWTAFNRRFDPGNERLLAGARADERRHLRLEVRYRRRSWAPYTVADDALLDLGPHLVDLARWLLGTEVCGVTDAVVTRQRASAELRTNGGTARIGCATDLPHRERAELRDADGRMVARRRTGGLVAGVLARVPGRRGAHPLTTSLTRQLAAFVEAARGGPALRLGTAADGLAAMRVLDTIRACAAAGRPVTVPGSDHVPRDQRVEPCDRPRGVRSTGPDHRG